MSLFPQWDALMKQPIMCVCVVLYQVIAAEGERAACEALNASIASLSDSPLAIQLRLLQLLHTLRSDQPTVLLNIPSNFLNQPFQLADTSSSSNQNQPTGDISEEMAKDSSMM